MSVITIPSTLENNVADPNNRQILENENTSNNVNCGRRTRRRPTDETHGNESVTYSDSIISQINKLFSNFEIKYDARFDRLNDTISELREQSSATEKSINFMASKYDELIERIESAERENCNLKKKVNQLELKLDTLERQSRSAMIEINNLPTVLNENREQLSICLKNIGSVIQQEITSSDIKNIYRLKPKHDQPRTGTVIVEFYSVTLKEMILKAVKTYNKEHKDSKLSTSSLNLPGHTKPIYVVESLTSFEKHLHFLGRKAVKDRLIDSCWTNRGKIFIKKTAGSIPTYINSEQELKNLLPTTC